MSRPRTDSFLKLGLSSFALVSGLLVLAIVIFLLKEAWPAIQSGRAVSFFTDKEWQPGSQRDPQFGLLPMLLASVLVTALAAIIAIPLGIGSAIFQVYYAPSWLARWQGRLMELLAGVPSIVFGFWGLTVLVPLIGKVQPPGQSLLAAGIVLALMVLPTIALTSRSALASIDPGLIQASAALGMSRPAQILSVALRAASPGIGTGCMLGLTRAIGETMAVVMVCGNIAKMPGSLFDPVRPITATIALEMGYATEAHKSLLYGTALVLIAFTALIMIFKLRRELR